MKKAIVIGLLMLVSLSTVSVAAETIENADYSDQVCEQSTVDYSTQMCSKYSYDYRQGTYSANYKEVKKAPMCEEAKPMATYRTENLALNRWDDTVVEQ